ncbi:MAG: hypothetical protein ACRDTX_16800 [Pseudonocardiaceae bacterium]
MTAVATTSFAIPRLPRRARTALLTMHVAVSVGWLGLDGALVALEVTGLGTGDPGERAGIAAAMAAIVIWVLIPVVFCSLASGLVLALSTSWGLVRYWWVLVKCGIASALTVTGLVLLLPRLHQIIAGDAEPVGMQVLVGRAIALALLLAATGLSVVKPWGRTPRGRSVHTGRKTVQQK